MRTLLFSLIDTPWKIATIAVLAIALHVTWIVVSGMSEHARRLGYALSILGTLATARGFLRLGTDADVVQRVQAEPEELEPDLAEAAEDLKHDTDEAERDVLAERVWGIGLLTVGQMLAGYGDLAAEWLGLAPHG